MYGSLVPTPFKVGTTNSRKEEEVCIGKKKFHVHFDAMLAVEKTPS